jgi:hypothetical protein
MPVMRDILNSTGQERTAWLNRTLKPAEEALRYYLGPDVARAGSGLGQLLTEMSPAADIRDMAQSSRDLMGSGSPMDAAGNAAMLGAAALGVFTPGSASSVKGASSDGVDAIVKALREGRAGEVTDDMLGALTPEQNARLFSAYERGETGADMAMDEASRMARAREMGFDTGTPLYHGTEADFPRFDQGQQGSRTQSPSAEAGTWATDSPRTAETYADFAATDAPVSALIEAAKRAEASGQLDEAAELMMQAKSLKGSIDKQPLQGQRILPLSMSSPKAYAGVFPSTMDAGGMRFGEMEARMNDGIEAARDNNTGGIDIFNLSDPGSRGLYDPARHSVRFSTKDIRSRFARFDPRLKNLSNLSAAVPGLFGAGTLGALLAARDDEVQQ